MAFLTDRKRAVGMGSAKTGTEHHWAMTVSSYGLLVLSPLFLFIVGPLLGKPYEDVIAALSSPFNAVIIALMLIVGFQHFKNGVQTLIEDYVHGYAREVAIIAMTCVSYGAMGFGLFALAKIAL